MTKLRTNLISAGIRIKLPGSLLLCIIWTLQATTSCHLKEEISSLEMDSTSQKKCEKFASITELVECLNHIVEDSPNDPIAHIIRVIPGKIDCGTSPESPQRADETHPRCFLRVENDIVLAYLIDNDDSLHVTQNDGIGYLFADFNYSEKRSYTAKEAVENANEGSHSCVGCHDPLFTKGLSVVQNKTYGVPYGELKKMNLNYRIKDSEIITFLKSLSINEKCSTDPKSTYCDRLAATLEKVTSSD